MRLNLAFCHATLPSSVQPKQSSSHIHSKEMIITVWTQVQSVSDITNDPHSPEISP